MIAPKGRQKSWKVGSEAILKGPATKSPVAKAQKSVDSRNFGGIFKRRRGFVGWGGGLPGFLPPPLPWDHQASGISGN